MTSPRASAWLWAPLLPIIGLVAGGIAALEHSNEATGQVLTIGLVVAGTPLLLRTTWKAAHGEFAADVVASLAIAASLLLHQPLAGLVVALMQSGGEALERAAEGRASDAVASLEREKPVRTHRAHGTAPPEDVDVAAVRVGDLLVILPGEMVPCDGTVIEGASHADVSRITGEPLPASLGAGVRIPSGAINLEGSVTIRADAIARESQYERIVELVRSAQSSKAPMQRLADRAARWFTPLTIITCALAYWMSGDPIRVLAVLVVATPCPLLLAVPVAIIGGINRAAQQLVVVRTAAALEQLSRIDTVVFDKTGTLTIGRPMVSRVIAWPPFSPECVLASAASLEARSGHLLARSVVDYAAASGVTPRVPALVAEVAGRGIRGVLDAHRVEVGARSWVHGAEQDESAGLCAFVGIDGRLAGRIEFADQLRGGLPQLLADLRALGVKRMAILSGDSASNTTALGHALGIDDVRAELAPEDKVAAVSAMVHTGARVLMVGDGTNDAPALSTATVGLALAAHGGGISAEAADIVLLADDVMRVRDALRIAQRAMHIARQSVTVGLVVSGAAMCAAAAGLIPPVTGALLQELLDAAVILNALRSSTPLAPYGEGRSAEASREVAASSISA